MMFKLLTNYSDYITITMIILNRLPYHKRKMALFMSSRKQCKTLSKDFLLGFLGLLDSGGGGGGGGGGVLHNNF